MPAPSTEKARRRVDAALTRAALGVPENPLEVASRAFERLFDDYEPAVIAEACRGWLRVCDYFAERPGEDVATPESIRRGRAFETFVRGLLAATTELEV